MYRVIILTANSTERKPLKSGLSEHGCQTTLIEPETLFRDEFVAPKADVLIADLDGSPVEAHKLCHTIKRDPSMKDLPLIVLLTEEQLGRIDFSWGVDDSLTLPVSAKRLAERVKFLLWKLNKIEMKNGLKLGGLAIDF